MSIIVEHVSKKYLRAADYALQDISFEFGHGIFGLLGPNGAGKTTLIKILASLIKPNAGIAYVNGFDTVKEAQGVRNSIGIIPQEYNLYPNLRAREFLVYMALLSRSGCTTKRILKVLTEVGLDHHANDKIHTFSGGMKQRLIIAQALIHDPPVLLIDEPTAGLDPAERVRFRNLFSEIALEKTVLLSTHIVEDIVATTDQVMLLDRGRLVYKGQISELVATANGKVWETKVNLKDWNKFKERFRILSFRQTPSLELIEVRFSAAGEKVPDGATSASPTIEDAYLLMISSDLK